MWSGRGATATSSTTLCTPPAHVQRRFDRLGRTGPYMSPRKLERRMGLEWRTALAAATPPHRAQLTDAPAVVQQQEEDAAVHFDNSAKLRALFLAVRPVEPLRPHQEEGVAFMRAREDTRTHGIGGGIVADAMRTGKTRMIWELVLEQLQAKVARGEPRFGAPTLLVVLKDCIDVFQSEYRKMFALGADMLGGPLRIVLACEGKHALTPAYALIRDADVVISTYSALQTGAHAAPGGRYAALFDIGWQRVVADEAHCFVNAERDRFEYMTRLRAHTSKWFVSATPIMNSVSELVAALRFTGLALESIPDPDDFAALRNDIILCRAFDCSVPDEPPPAVVTLEMPFATLAEQRCYTFYLDKLRAAGTLALFNVTHLRQLCILPTRVPGVAEAAGLVVEKDVLHNNPQYRRVCTLVTREALLGETMSARDAELVYNAPFLPPVFTKERQVLHALRTVVEPAGEKLIVFSPWTSPLQRLAALLTRRAVLQQRATPSHVLVDGTMTTEARTAAFDAFRNDPARTCLLVTTGTGSRGIDLTVANHEIHFNQWWNPTVEDQANGRILGTAQTRATHMTRLVMGGTVETHILNIQERKRALPKDLLPQTRIKAEHALEQSLFRTLLA